jgi:hypothetical protein
VAFENAGGKKFFGIGRQERPPTNRMQSGGKRYGLSEGG